MEIPMSTPPQPGTIFIVVDPAQDRPLALERAVITSKIFKGMEQGDIPKVHVFLAVDADNTDTSADNPNIHRSSEWFLKRIVEPLKEAGGQYSVEISWSTDWYGSILKAAKEQNAERIMIPMVKKPGGSDRVFNESMWKMMRTAHCPVLIVQPDSPAERKTVLVAINIQSSKPEYQKLNDLIINRGQWLAKSYGADLHVVNAYKSSLRYPDRGELAKKTQVDTANIHVMAGNPEDVIPEVVKAVGADIVVLGTQSRSSRWRGNTSEKIITKVNCDILAIN
jgi:universal stress protein E